MIDRRFILIFVDYIINIIKLRYDDIVYRHNVIKEKIEEREKIIASNKNFQLKLLKEDEKLPDSPYISSFVTLIKGLIIL